jgi:ABC-type phosphate transport system auxiliary subunit
MVESLTSKVKSNTIIPDKNIYGDPYGLHEDEFIKKHGKPTGYIQLSTTESGMLYGKSHMFFFTNRKLSGVRISHNILDWRISQQITAVTEFDNYRWKLDNGIRNQTSLADVKKILGSNIQDEEDNYKRVYEAGDSVVTLDFSHMTSLGENDSAYKIHSLLITKK